MKFRKKQIGLYLFLIASFILLSIELFTNIQQVITTKKTHQNIIDKTDLNVNDSLVPPTEDSLWEKSEFMDEY
jgi:hypothetical protein